MTEQSLMHPQAGSFAAVRELYIKAAAYDAGFARYADHLAASDRRAKMAVIAVTAVTSLTAFGSLFVDNPHPAAKLVVFALAATASVLTALRQDGQWAKESEKSRAAGAKWTHQRNLLRCMAAKICDGGRIVDGELRTISERDEKLVASNPYIPDELYRDLKAEKKQDFDAAFTFPRAVAVVADFPFSA